VKGGGRKFSITNIQLGTFNIERKSAGVAAPRHHGVSESWYCWSSKAVDGDLNIFSAASQMMALERDYSRRKGKYV